jgi:hypothetical protein
MVSDKNLPVISRHDLNGGCLCQSILMSNWPRQFEFCSSSCAVLCLAGKKSAANNYISNDVNRDGCDITYTIVELSVIGS